MCGICGFNWQDRETVTRMARAMQHRGPDQAGVYCDEQVSLGHQRLSIIDLSDHGRQPMSNEDGSVWLVFNGEIYNHRDLRKWLQGKGHTFKSLTDSEVIVHAYEELGVNCLQKLNGMFAFAIWDRKAQALFVARDRLGEKPLYYRFDGGRLIFASEIKALLQNPHIEAEVDEQALYHFIGFEFVPAPLTMFKGIRKLPAGHYLHLADGKLDRVQYWDLPSGEIDKPRRDWQDELHDHLQRAVKLRMQSDVPLGAFLSGGIDSSTIIAMMREATNGPIRTFSLGYAEAAFSEFEYAKRVADHFGTLHTELLIDPVTPDVIERAIWHLDEPLSEFSVLPYYLLCQKAREHVTVCLSGEGGDEVFAGYDRFKASKAARRYTRLPGWLWQAVDRFAQGLPDRPQKKGATNSLKRFIEGAALPDSGHHMRWQYFLTPRAGTGLLQNGTAEKVIGESLALVQHYTEQRVGGNQLAQEIYAELKFMMPENPLMKVDKMSMAHALEIRAPLLDHELVEFAAQIPGHLKLEGWTSKSIFKSTMDAYLPEGIAYRSKHGYSFPIKHWLRKELKAYTEDVIRQSSIIKEHFNHRYIETLFSEHATGRQNHNHLLWGLLNLALWHQRYVATRATYG